MSLDSRYVDSTSHDQHSEDLSHLTVGTTLTCDYGIFHRALTAYLQISTEDPQGEEGTTSLPKRVFNSLPKERRKGNHNFESRLSQLRAALINTKVRAASRQNLLPGEDLSNPFRENDSFEDAVYLAKVAQAVGRDWIARDLESPLSAEQITAAVRRLLSLGQEEQSAPHL
jgi:hypothetical protein